MFKQLSGFGTAFEKYMTHRGRVEALNILKNQSEKTLEDIGVCRHELQGGVKNWPWDGSVTKMAATASSPIEQVKAVRELTTYSDRELHDLGINRGMIADAVANGRAGIDSDLPPTRPSNTGDERQAA